MGVHINGANHDRIAPVAFPKASVPGVHSEKCYVKDSRITACLLFLSGLLYLFLNFLIYRNIFLFQVVLLGSGFAVSGF